MSKKLVAYFSASGITENVATELAKLAGADIYEIVPETPYTHADLDWTDKKSRSTIEMQDKNSRPALANDIPDMKNYDEIFIGFPVWWYTAPHIINTFLEKFDLSGKKIYTFATSGSSGVEKCVSDLAAMYPNAQWQPGKLLNGGVNQSKLNGWL